MYDRSDGLAEIGPAGVLTVTPDSLFSAPYTRLSIPRRLFECFGHTRVEGQIPADD